ncbi:transglycosylase SLT domain-containing protein [Aliikangiella sp. IMCC44653]
MAVNKLNSKAISIIVMGLFIGCLEANTAIKDLSKDLTLPQSNTAKPVSAPLTDKKHALSEQQLATKRALFLKAEKALLKGRYQEFKQLLTQLEDYPLKSYLIRDYLLKSRQFKHTQAIEAFFNEFGEQPVARKLRYKWLYWLADNDYSQLFLRHYRSFNSPHLICKQLEFRRRLNENPKDVFNQVANVWATANSLPKACDPILAAWKKSGLRQESQVWQRLIKVVKANNYRLIKYLKKQLAPDSRDAADLLIAANKRPYSLKKVKFSLPLTDKAHDIIEIALGKLAWQNPNQAIELWQHLSTHYQLNRELPQVKRNISLSLAINRDPKAEDWLSSLTHSQDESVKHWLLSSALNRQDWPKILQLTQNFIDAGDSSNQWQYWNAVAATQIGDLVSAKSRFEALAATRSYYGFLSARQLNIPANLAQQSFNFAASELDELANAPTALRAKELYQLKRFSLARSEWNYLVRQTPHQEQIKLAHIAHLWGWQHQAILAFARSKQIDDVAKRFPLAHLETFNQYAQKHSIPVSWAFAIARQESAFKADAHSRVGAKGLMQLKHTTAKSVAKRQDKYHHANQLLNPETNIKLGTAHLGKMYTSFKDNPVLATAAYNAGKSRVDEWLKLNNSENSIYWIEQIPYKETREYVKNVLTYQLIYAQLTNQSEVFIDRVFNAPISSQIGQSGAK